MPICQRFVHCFAQNKDIENKCNCLNTLWRLFPHLMNSSTIKSWSDEIMWGANSGFGIRLSLPFLLCYNFVTTQRKKGLLLAWSKECVTYLLNWALLQNQVLHRILTLFSENFTTGVYTLPYRVILSILLYILYNSSKCCNESEISLGI